MLPNDFCKIILNVINFLQLFHKRQGKSRGVGVSCLLVKNELFLVIYGRKLQNETHIERAFFNELVKMLPTSDVEAEAEALTRAFLAESGSGSGSS